MKEDKDILVLKIYLHIAAIIHSRLQLTVETRIMLETLYSCTV